MSGTPTGPVKVVLKLPSGSPVPYLPNEVEYRRMYPTAPIVQIQVPTTAEAYGGIEVLELGPIIEPDLIPAQPVEVPPPATPAIDTNDLAAGIFEQSEQALPFGENDDEE